MSLMEDLTAKGLDEKFMEILAGCGADESLQADIMGKVEEFGLKGPKILKWTGDLHRDKKITKNPYPKFAALAKELAAGGSTNSGAAADVTGKDEELTLTGDQEQLVKDAMLREEEKIKKQIQKRMEKAEAMFRQKAAAGEALVSSRAGRTPSGVPADQMDRWVELQGIIQTCKDVRKAESVKMALAKDEMLKIRPPKKRAKVAPDSE